jgi:hypothetical protein
MIDKHLSCEASLYTGDVFTIYRVDAMIRIQDILYTDIIFLG